ncbi:MAG TPA: TetR/AcrR family transcriptional regulator [Streptosporangiaceae bacterium]|jgi:AcrR family transcriptional regulator
MISRLESATNTRRALLDAAAELLDAGGPEAATLREVGARAGVSRNAPYRHFADKEGLLTAVAVESWDRLAEALRTSGAINSAPSTRLQQALTAIVELGRNRPHLYRLMFVIPESDPGAGARAASRAQEEFLSIVAAVVGEADARHYGALLFSSAHGIAGLEISGHLTEEKWRTTAEDLIATLVVVTADHHPATRTT